MSINRRMGKEDEKNKIMLDLEMVILSEVSQTEKDKYHTESLTYGI